jgi:hypothetical protein
MHIRFRTCLLLRFAAALVPPATRAGDDEAAVKKLMKPGFRVVREGKTLVELHTLGARDEDLVGLKRFKSVRVLGVSNSHVPPPPTTPHATVPTTSPPGVAARNTAIVAKRSPTVPGVSTVSSKAAGVYCPR